MIDEEEGMREEVAAGASPLQPPLKTLSINEVINREAKGLFSQFTEIGGKEFIQYRSPGRSIRFSLSYLVVLRAAWRISGQRRARGEDPGVTRNEMAEAIGTTDQKINHCVRSLVKNGLLRVQSTQQGLRLYARHYPTEEGVMLYGIAETLGMNTSIMIGGSSMKWHKPAQDVQGNVFLHAKMLRERGIGL